MEFIQDHTALQETDVRMPAQADINEKTDRALEVRYTLSLLVVLISTHLKNNHSVDYNLVKKVRIPV